MSKWAGKIGFGLTEETEPGIFIDHIIEKSYRGEIIKNSHRNQSSGEINDNLTISNQLKVIAGPFIQKNLSHIRYVTWFGARWKVTSITPSYPHVILDIGDVYNGETPQ